MNLDILQITFLAVLQGFTEFLPISSSGHLLLPSLLFGWDDQGLTFDVAVHVGSLLAVIAYFFSDLLRLANAWMQSIVASKHDEDSKLAWLLLLATIPAGVIGLLLNNEVETYARSIPVVACASIIFAIFLQWSDKGRAGADGSLAALNWKKALLIGCAQVLALIPGASRSGVTMMAAMFCKLDRTAAARFSFLLAIPIILATGGLKIIELWSSGTESPQWQMLLYAILVAAGVAFCCIHFFLKLISRIGFLPFVVYRIALGLGLLAFYFA